MAGLAQTGLLAGPRTVSRGDLVAWHRVPGSATAHFRGGFLFGNIWADRPFLGTGMAAAVDVPLCPVWLLCALGQFSRYHNRPASVAGDQNHRRGLPDFARDKC